MSEQAARQTWSQFAATTIEIARRAVERNAAPPSGPETAVARRSTITVAVEISDMICEIAQAHLAAARARTAIAQIGHGPEPIASKSSSEGQYDLLGRLARASRVRSRGWEQQGWPPPDPIIDPLMALLLPEAGGRTGPFSAKLEELIERHAERVLAAVRSGRLPPPERLQGRLTELRSAPPIRDVLCALELVANGNESQATPAFADALRIGRNRTGASTNTVAAILALWAGWII
jgi:hypothetical protein